MRITHLHLIAVAAIVIVIAGVAGTYAASPEAEAAGFHDTLYANTVTPASGGNSMRFFYNHRADDASAEWLGFYSGTTRSALMLWDGAYAGCDGDKFCIIGEGHQLSLRSQTDNVLVDDTLEVAQDGEVQGEVRAGSLGSLDGSSPLTFNSPIRLPAGSMLESYAPGGTTNTYYGTCDYWGGSVRDASCPSGENQVGSDIRSCTMCTAPFNGVCYGEYTQTYTNSVTCATPAEKQRLEFSSDGETVWVRSGDGDGRIEPEAIRVCAIHTREDNTDHTTIIPVTDGFQRQTCRNLASNPIIHQGHRWGIGCIFDHEVSFSGYQPRSSASAPDPSPNCGW